LGAFVERALGHAGVRGASVAVIHDGEAPWIRAFGVRDQRSGERVTERTVFEAASLGKVVAAWAALMLVEEGEWALDMPVRTARLVVSPGCDAPTLLQLLSHTAGLSNNLLAERYEGACHPPAPFSYAGQGWLVLQELFEAHAGAPIEDVMQTRVFAPLGMARSSFVPPRGEDVAVGHVDALWGVGAGVADGWVIALGAAVGVLAVLCALAAARTARRRHSGWKAAGFTAILWFSIALVVFGAGSAWTVPVRPWSARVMLPSSLHTSAEDLVRFAEEVLQPRFVRPETRDMLFEPRVEVGGGIAWGAGVGIDYSVRPVTGWQWGSNPGFQGLLVLEPSGGDAVLVLTNTGGFSDVVSRRRGGYNAAKRIARRALGLNGRWDLHREAPRERTYRASARPRAIQLEAQVVLHQVHQTVEARAVHGLAALVVEESQRPARAQEGDVPP
jgi:CubicO group peptidase (beta-lactamase class C family)